MRLRIAASFFASMLVGVMLVSCTGQKQNVPTMTILIRMMPAQERFFREDIVAKFEKEHKCKINVAAFENQWDIEKMLQLESSKKTAEIGLVKVPFEVTRPLVYKGLMMPLFQANDSDRVNADIAEYHQLAAGLGYVDNVLYYIPRKLETRILFYRKSMVADAVAKFEKYKATITAALKKQNGYGLPKEYAFENDPGQWDFYDVFVAGWIWSHEEYNGVKMARIAHRGERYEGTALDIVDKSLQLGSAQDTTLELKHADIMKLGDPVVQALLWENVFIRNGLYNPGMWEDPWRGSDMYKGVSSGKIFLTYLQQIDCFNVHGWSDDPGMPTYLPDTNDMGMSVVPQAVSFALDGKGAPVYAGSRAISTGGWWWGIPKTSPNAKLAYALARFITSRENQANECSKFGMIPVRKDILANLPNVFEEGWVGDIFKTSVDQVKLNELTTVPLVREYTDAAKIIIDAWYTLCIGYDEKKDGKMDAAVMKAKLAKDFAPKLNPAGGASAAQ